MADKKPQGLTRAIKAQYVKDLANTHRNSPSDIAQAMRRLSQWAASGHIPEGLTYEDLHWMYDQAAKELKHRNKNSKAGGNFPAYKSAHESETVEHATECQALTTALAAARKPARDSESVRESVVSEPGRVKEAKGSDAAGGRIFGVQIIDAGDSKNGRRYPHQVLSEAAPLYEGAKAFDHHRSDAELEGSTIVGIVGQYRNVTANSTGLEADLHLLPSATHTAEALDASLAAQAAGLSPLVGISHDVLANWRPVADGGRHVQEATKIARVLSADVVADPAAGGRAIRMVAGGLVDDTPSTDPEEGPTMSIIDQLRAEVGDWSEDDKAEIGRLLGFGTDETTEPTDTATPAGQAEEPAEPEKVLVGAGAPESVRYTRESIVGRRIVRDALEDGGFSRDLAARVLKRLGESFTEDDVAAEVGRMQDTRESEGDVAKRITENDGTTEVKVGQEAIEAKRARLDKTFAGNFSEGYHSIRQAYLDITGSRTDPIDGDLPSEIIRESRGFDRRGRASEAVTSSTWSDILGDSITRRMVAEYKRPDLNTWRQIATVVPVNDFRTQRRDRMGGYGALPSVSEGADYTALTSPSDEEATYSVSKRGGTESLTMETVANDDIGAVARIPVKLGFAAAQTVYKFVFDFLTSTSNIYDGKKLFDDSTQTDTHNNSGTAALASDALGSARAAMVKQKADGEQVPLGIIARTLVVPPDLAQKAFEIVHSTVKATSNEDGTVANYNGNLQIITVDYYTDSNNWFLVADPSSIPTIEVGFYQGRDNPELFVQNSETVGSTFDADKVTYKIRHIYSGAVLDYRGFYASVVADT